MLRDLATLIEESGLGTYATDLYVSRLPDTPVNCVAVSAYQGQAPGYVQELAAPLVDRPSFQVLVRSHRDLGMIAVETKAYAIWEHLASVTNRTVGSTHFLALRPYQSPFEIPSDNSDHFLYAFNGEAKIRR